MALNAEQLKNMLDKGFILLSNNGIIESAKLPEFGSLTIIMQDGRPVSRKYWLRLNLLLTRKLEA